MTPDPHADTDTDTTVRRPESVAALWVGLLLAPAAFLIGLVVTYALSAPVCEHRHDLLLHGVHAITVLAGGGGLLVAWSCQRPTRYRRSAAAIGPGVRFLPRVAVGTSALFVLVMLVQWVPSFVYAGCR